MATVPYQCHYPDCTNMVTGTRLHHSSKYCSPRHQHQAYYRANRDKLLATSKARSAARYSETADKANLTYRDYKEPLTHVTDGFGYMGTIAQSEDGERVQCHICGLMFKGLSQHVNTHKVTAREYKAKFQLAVRTSLLSDGLRRRYTANYQERWSEERKDNLRRIANDINSGANRSGAKKGQNSWPLERRNKEGNCPDQVLDKIKKLADKLGRTPSHNDFIDEYGTKYLGTINYFYGSWTKGVKAAGMTPVREATTLDRGYMLEQINIFREKHGREPLWGDFKHDKTLPSPHTYWRSFGGVREARKLADALKVTKGVTT